MHEFLEDPFKVGEGILPVGADLLDEGVDDGTPIAGVFPSKKHPVLCAQFSRTDGVLGQVIIKFDPPIFKAGLKVRPLVDGVL